MQDVDETVPIGLNDSQAFMNHYTAEKAKVK